MKHIALVVLFAGLTLGACADGSSGDTSAPPEAGDALGHGSTTSTTLDFGELSLEVPDGFYAAPFPEPGFGLAVPDGFQAVLLTDQALEVFRSAGVPDEGFVSAVVNAADSGALFYAAGLSPEGSVTDVKIDVVPTSDPDAALLQFSQDTASQPDLADLDIESDPDAGIVRIRFTSPGPESSLERAQGTQFLYRAPDAVWSMIVTSESATDHDLVADAIGATFVLAQ